MSSKKKNVRMSVHVEADASSPYQPQHYQLNGSRHDLINAKSQYEAEFRRFAIDSRLLNSVEKLHNLLERLHDLGETEFYITYIDKTDGELLPINNDDNYAQALRSYAPPSVLRIHIQRKDQDGRATGYQVNRSDPGSSTSRTPFRSLLSRDQNNGGGGNSSSNVRRRNNNQAIQIGRPENFRPVSSIIDADILPETLRRVKMMKHNNERPLGFYIRDGVCVRPTSNGIEKVPGIYISRVVQGGLAESTGLLNVDDEVLEVNGIDVEGKTLDQVTDMMIANSSNLILTIKPANQGHASWSGGAAAGGTMGDRSSSSKLSRGSAHSATSSSRSSGASSSLPRRGGKGGNENHAAKSSSKLPSSLLTTARAAQQQQQQNTTGINNGNSSSTWRDAKFRTSQISQASSSASSSSMSPGGAGGVAQNVTNVNYSPYDADDMDEVREYTSNTAAALEVLQQRQRYYNGNSTNEDNHGKGDAPPSAQRRSTQQQQQQLHADDAGGFVNSAFSEHPGDARLTSAVEQSNVTNGTRSSRGGAAAVRNSSASQTRPEVSSGTSTRPPAVDLF